jgi:hypothetical protein
MQSESAVDFGTDSRIHMGLGVRDVDRSMGFYLTLFGKGPTKTRPHYAKFKVADPPMNLSLNEILADALQDAGCDNADILGHCRGPGPHVRGCWVVDLVLGKG